ncbi:MAG: hypothetical protein JWP21_711 [Tardiphaga sp.]|nr:hypothetical protein [Tardiphaga sp.]MDB5630508.1 hypothetical protein [Tardiphaga sp.]
MTAMRSTEPNRSTPARAGFARALRLSAAALGVGLLMSTTFAHAQSAIEDDEDTFEEKIIKNIMTGLGGTNMENTGIEYRERSPLVVPPKIELRAPDDGNGATAANWPKDPDVQRRKAAKTAAGRRKDTPEEARRILSPSELAVGRTAPEKRSAETNMPGDPGANAILSPSQLGFTGGLSSIFGGGSKTETATFTAEPTRDSLTMPPSGYQTPSSNFAYGTGPKESLNKEYNPAQGKY